MDESVSESMSAVERALWRIAELGARCGQQSGEVDRRPMWEELERIITDVATDVASAREAAETATGQLGRLQGRLIVARKERDRERTLVQQHRADAEAARREREQAIAERDAAIAERDALAAARDASLAEFEGALASLAARAEGAVVVLPEVIAPDSVVAASPPARVAWHPAWSEWAEPDLEPNAGVAAAVSDQPETPRSGEQPDVPPADTPSLCYLNVAASAAQLLPADLDALLVPGVSVVRREGRLFATLAVESTVLTANGGSAAEELLRNLTGAGLKLEWTSATSVSG